MLWPHTQYLPPSQYFVVSLLGSVTYASYFYFKCSSLNGGVSVCVHVDVCVCTVCTCVLGGGGFHNLTVQR